MKFKLMLIDDDFDEREEAYRKVLSPEDFDLVVMKSAQHLEDSFEKIPVDGYLVDVCLGRGSWDRIGNAGTLFSKFRTPPRKAPVFLVSMKWGVPETIHALNKIRQIRDLEVLRYLTWPEFERATKEAKDKKEGNETPELAALRGKILDDLSLWHERSTFRPKDDQNIRILVLADLQYGDPHTSSYSTFSEQWIPRVLRNDNRIPDIVILAGDIAYSGSPSEYELAKQKLEVNLFEELWGVSAIDSMRERILVAPGNHDVNLRFLACNRFKWLRDEKKWDSISEIDSAAQTGTRVEQNRYALEPFRRFVSEITGSRTWEGDLTLSNVDRRFENSGLRLYLLNSVSQSSLDNPTNSEFCANELQRINRSLGSKDNPKDFFNIAISHHGIQSGEPDAEQIANWTSVGKQFFSMNNIGLWIFGHYHKGKLTSEDIDTHKLDLLHAPTLRIVPQESSHRGFTLIDLARSSGKVTGGDVYFYRLEENGTPTVEPTHKKLSITP